MNLGNKRLLRELESGAGVSSWVLLVLAATITFLTEIFSIICIFSFGNLLTVQIAYIMFGVIIILSLLSNILYIVGFFVSYFIWFRPIIRILTNPSCSTCHKRKRCTDLYKLMIIDDFCNKFELGINVKLYYMLCGVMFERLLELKDGDSVVTRLHKIIKENELEMKEL